MDHRRTHDLRRVAIARPRLLPLLLLLVAGPTPGGSASAQPDADDPAIEQVIEAQSEANQASVVSQQRIDALSDETEELLARYRTALRQRDALRIYNDQMRALIASQEQELGSLSEQLDRVDVVGRGVTPLMLEMIEALEAFVEFDIPFLLDERRERVASLRRLMNRADVTNAEKYRQIMEAFQIEADFGRSIEAYRGTIDRGDGEITVDFLRFGRVALVYQSLDETLRGAWDKRAGDWVELDARYRTPIRQGLRIARKQAAPDLVTLPLPSAEGS